MVARHSVENKEEVQKFGRHAWDSMCGGFGCIYLMEGEELFIMTDCGTKKSLKQHPLGKGDDWGACSLGPVLHRGNSFFLVCEDGTEVFLFEKKCKYWQGGQGCIYLVDHYDEFFRYEVVLK